MASCAKANRVKYLSFLKKRNTSFLSPKTRYLLLFLLSLFDKSNKHILRIFLFERIISTAIPVLKAPDVLTLYFDMFHRTDFGGFLVCRQIGHPYLNGVENNSVEFSSMLSLKNA